MKRLTKRAVSCLLIALLSFAAMSNFSACGKKKKTSDLTVSKSTYMTGEEIVVTATGDDDDWVGVYRLSDDPANIDPIAKYPVYSGGFISGQSYIIQRSATFSDNRQLFKNFPAVKYKVILFGSDGTRNILKTENFSVDKNALTLPASPTKMKYEQSCAGSGLADGVLTVEFPSENFNATELLLYWADENGILQDYTSLAKVKISSNPFEYRFVSGTLIPAKATAIVAYSVNKKGISESYCRIDLPENSGYNMNGDVLSKFQVTSDVHIAVIDKHLASGDAKELHSSHLKSMAEDIVSVCPGSDALIIVGDIANSGQESEWKKTAEILGGVSGLPSVYYALGNHDLYEGSYKTKIGYFYNYANVQSVYYEKVIGGYHHIFLGSESNDKSGVDADISEAQLTWLNNKLKEITAKEPNKQVFVYLHQSLYNTVAGSFKGQGWNGIMQDERVREILKKYPQVYFFNGHSHWDMNSYGNAHLATNDLPNVFNTASVAYLWTSYDNPTGEYLRGSQGYYIYVYEDKVLVLGRDFEQEKFIPSACYEAKILSK